MRIVPVPAQPTQRFSSTLSVVVGPVTVNAPDSPATGAIVADVACTSAGSGTVVPIARAPGPTLRPGACLPASNKGSPTWCAIGAVNWRPRLTTDQILDEIAEHARQHPDWLEQSS